MKKFIFLAAIASVTMLFVTSCGYKSVETPLDDNLTSFTVKTNDGAILYGVKDISDTQIIAPEYDSVSLFGSYILATKESDQWLYTTAGTLVFDVPASQISQETFGIVFSKDDMLNVLFNGQDAIVGPFARWDERNGFFFAQSAQAENLCFVYTTDGRQVAAGEKINYLRSAKDKKAYFLVTMGKTVTAYDEAGTEVFPLNVKKLAKLPKPEWQNGNVCATEMKASLTAFKGVVPKKNKKR